MIPARHRAARAPLCLIAAATIAATPLLSAASSLQALQGRTVWNRSIYRLVKADGSSFRIKALTPLRLVRVEARPDLEVPWFDVEGRGEARPADSDISRIKAWRAAGKLPADWSWVYGVDPRSEHKDWDETFWKAIADRTIVNAMTPDMVRMAFGEPDRINVNKRPENVQEHWIYPTGSIWFVEGKVFTWQAP